MWPDAVLVPALNTHKLRLHNGPDKLRIRAVHHQKLKADNAVEMMLKEVMIEGLLSIQAGENPRVIEEKLKSFLSPSDREAVASDAGGEE